MGDFLEEIFAFPFIIYSFIFLIPLSNTPQIFLAQILVMSPIIISLLGADLSRFFWQLFVLFSSEQCLWRMIGELGLAKV